MSIRACLTVLCLFLANVDISQQQVFRRQLADQNVAENTDLFFTIEVFSNVTDNGVWIKNGGLVQNTTRITVFPIGQNRNLGIVNATSLDSGTYLFFIQGQVTSFTLSVISIAFNEHLPNPMTGFVGSTVTLQTNVSQSNFQDGRWYKDRQEVVNTTRIQSSATELIQSLTINNAQISDSGEYEFRIYNIRTATNLSVVLPPSLFVEIPLEANTRAFEGATVTLQTTLSQRDIRRGEWFKDDVLIVLGGSSGLVYFTDGKVQYLNIPIAQISDSGRYEYRVDNLVTTTTILTVVVQQDINILTDLANVTVEAGQSVTFELSLSRRNVITGNWRKDDSTQDIVAGGRIQTPVSNEIQKLIITNVQPSDAGRYTFSVNGQSRSAYLNVIVPIGLAIVTGLQDITGATRQSIVFQVELNKLNINTGVWRKGQDVVPNMDRGKTQISVTGLLQVLLISDLQLTDAGNYSYSVDGLTTFGVLTVTQGITVSLGLRNITVLAGSTVRFAVTLSQPGIGGGTWTKNGVLLPNSTRTEILIDGLYQRLIIYNAQLTDIALYTYTVDGLTSGGYLNVIPVAVDGNWGGWSSWIDVSCATITCGTGTLRQNRTRFCNSPAPRNGGQFCVGNSFDDSGLKTCISTPCPIDGVWREWSQWSQWSICSVSCGSGSRTHSRSRTCNQPQFNGQACQGSTTGTESEGCSAGNCPVDGVWRVWSQWSQWSICSVSCGSGSRTHSRSRTCNQPQFNGQPCQGSTTGTESEGCSAGNCPVNGNWGEWTSWADPPCGITCGSRSDVFRNRSRVCDNPPARFGGNPCVGRSADPQQKTCIFPPCVFDLCTNALVVDSVGYRYHPTDCDKYIQCYYNPNGKVVASIRRCPFGQFWDQSIIRCNEAYRVSCPLDRCRDNCTGNYNMLGSCASYWQCDRNSVARPRCCAIGFSYVDGQGCQPNFFCRDNCPTACVDRDVCTKHPVWDNTDAYNVSVGLLGWLRASCLGGSFFDITDCGCSAANATCQASYDLSFSSGNVLTNALATWLARTNVQIFSGYAYFSGNGKLTANIKMPMAARGCPLIIRFRYRETAGVSGRKVLLSTSDCRRGNSLVIAVDNDDMMFELTSWYGWVVKLPIRLTGFGRADFKTVTLMYSGYDMMVSVENAKLKYTAKVPATESTIMNCGLVFGTDGMNSANDFRGQLDQLTIYKCNPGRLY